MAGTAARSICRIEGRWGRWGGSAAFALRAPKLPLASLSPSNAIPLADTYSNRYAYTNHTILLDSISSCHIVYSVVCSRSHTIRYHVSGRGGGQSLGSHVQPPELARPAGWLVAILKAGPREALNPLNLAQRWRGYPSSKAILCSVRLRVHHPAARCSVRRFADILYMAHCRKTTVQFQQRRR